MEYEPYLFALDSCSMQSVIQNGWGEACVRSKSGKKRKHGIWGEGLSSRSGWSRSSKTVLWFVTFLLLLFSMRSIFFFSQSYYSHFSKHYLNIPTGDAYGSKQISDLIYPSFNKVCKCLWNPNWTKKSASFTNKSLVCVYWESHFQHSLSVFSDFQTNNSIKDPKELETQNDY